MSANYYIFSTKHSLRKHLFFRRSIISFFDQNTISENIFSFAEVIFKFFCLFATGKHICIIEKKEATFKERKKASVLLLINTERLFLYKLQKQQSFFVKCQQGVFIKKNYLPAALVLLITLKSYEDHVEKSTKRNFRDRDCDRDSRVAIAIVTAIEFSERRS